MKNKNWVYFSILIFFTACYTPRYLPDIKTVDINTNGAYIIVDKKSKSYTMGELIAVDSVKIIVLTDSVLYHVKFAEVIKLSEINHYTLRYAKPKHYGPLIPLYWLGSVFHGYYFVLTAPINILTTSIVTSTGEKAFTYNEKDLNFKKLKMFARFPQGLPPNIDINQIR